MLSVALASPGRQVRLAMTGESDEEYETRLLGRALAALREAAGQSQDEAAEKAGYRSYQGWQRWETGQPGLFKPKTKLRLTKALGFDIDALDRMASKIRAEEKGEPSRRPPANDDNPHRFEISVDGRGRAGGSAPIFDDMAGSQSFRDLAWMFGRNVRYMAVGGESMTGYVEAGAVIGYDLTQWPRRGDGCVIELHTGERYVKEYLRSDQKRIYARQLFPKDELSWEREQVKGVYKIKVRLD